MRRDVGKFWAQKFRWGLTCRLLDLLQIFALGNTVLVGLPQRESVLSKVQKLPPDQPKKARSSPNTASTCVRTHGCCS